MPSAFVLVGTHVRLDRGGLSGPAPATVEGLLAQCRAWAGEVGWDLAVAPTGADGIVVGPGIQPPPLQVPVAAVQPGAGIDGFRWALRHLAFTAQWPVQTVHYARGPDHVADVRRPGDSDSSRVAVLLHGGFWMDAWRRDLMDGLAVDLTRRGWTTVNVEYRRVGAGGTWPAPGRDVLAALDRMAHDRVGTNGVVLVGHSAGAQLALWAAGERPEQVTRVVSLAGLCDLETAQRHRLGGSAVDNLLVGEPPEVASPIARLPLGVPTVLAHLADDPVVPVDQSRRYAEAATAASDDIHLLEIDGDDHMALIEPAKAWPQVADLLT
ncbi:MAG TPA: alpha/beta hydrolase [Egibacteraceae bacterium]|nr:alpha/beta hydrolase [Egibacteraceae bacterium]